MICMYVCVGNWRLGHKQKQPRRRYAKIAGQYRSKVVNECIHTYIYFFCPFIVTRKVLDFDLQRQLYDHLQPFQPLPSIFDPRFIAANQADRVDNTIPGLKD